MCDLSRNSWTKTFFKLSGPTTFLGIFSLFVGIPGPGTWCSSCAVQGISHPRFRPFLRISPGFLGNLGSKLFPAIAFKSPYRNCSSSSHPICPDFVSRSGNSCYHFLLSEISISLCRAEELEASCKETVWIPGLKSVNHKSDFFFLWTYTTEHTAPRSDDKTALSAIYIPSILWLPCPSHKVKNYSQRPC